MRSAEQRGLPRALVLAAGVAAAGAGAALLAYARFIELFRWQVSTHEIGIRGLGPAFDGFRIVQLSDLHMTGVMTPERLREVAALAQALRPDAVVITGDFVTAERPFDGAALAGVLRSMQAAHGCYGVLGNHDRRPHVQAVRRALREGGLTELDNRVVTLRRGADVLHIAGVDSLYRRHARLDLVLSALPAEGPAILLAHEPDFADVAAAARRFALQLSGHAHGGQVRIPFLTRFGLPRYGVRYVSGMHNAGGMLVYAHRGIGTTSAPLRFRSRPEIALFVLRAGGGAAHPA